MGEGSLDDQLGEVMWSSPTDSVDVSNSSSSLSTEDRHSYAPGSGPRPGSARSEGMMEKNGAEDDTSTVMTPLSSPREDLCRKDPDEGGPSQPGKTKKKEKNREAARKSRKKQTERADQLHQELESLETSNSALRKEISFLEKTAHFYTTTLERHKPFCLLQGPGSGSVAPPSVSCPVSAQASASTTTPSASFGGCSPLTPTPTAPSCELFPYGSSNSSPPSSAMTAPAPHSLFHCSGWEPSNPPPPTPCPGSVPHTPPGPLDEILIDSKPGHSQPSAAHPGLLLSLLTVPSPPRAPQTSAGTADGSPAQQWLLEDTSGDLSFLELVEVNDWILQQREMDPGFSEQ